MLNSLYVGVLDMLLGVCFILLLFYGEEHLMAALATPFDASRRVYIDFLREYVDWLIDEPAGLKLHKSKVQDNFPEDLHTVRMYWLVPS